MAILIPEGYMVIALHGIIQLVSNSTRTFVFRKYLKVKLIKDFLKPVIGLFIVQYLYLKGPKKKKEAKSFSKVGFISGFSTVFIGATGPLIAPFFINEKFSKENIIANKAACQVISHFGKIP